MKFFIVFAIAQAVILQNAYGAIINTIPNVVSGSIIGSGCGCGGLGIPSIAGIQSINGIPSIAGISSIAGIPSIYGPGSAVITPSGIVSSLSPLASAYLGNPVVSAPATTNVIQSNGIANSLADTLSLLTVSNLLADKLPLGLPYAPVVGGCGCNNILL